MRVTHSSPKRTSEDVNASVLNLKDPFPDETFIADKSNLNIGSKMPTEASPVIQDVLWSNDMMKETNVVSEFDSKEESHSSGVLIIDEDKNNPTPPERSTYISNPLESSGSGKLNATLCTPPIPSVADICNSIPKKVAADDILESYFQMDKNTNTNEASLDRDSRVSVDSSVPIVIGELSKTKDNSEIEVPIPGTSNDGSASLDRGQLVWIASESVLVNDEDSRNIEPTNSSKYSNPESSLGKRKKVNGLNINRNIWRQYKLQREPVIRRSNAREVFMQRKVKRKLMNTVRLVQCKSNHTGLFQKNHIMNFLMKDTCAFQSGRMKHKHHKSKSSIRLSLYALKKSSKTKVASMWKKERNVHGYALRARAPSAVTCLEHGMRKQSKFILS